MWFGNLDKGREKTIIKTIEMWIFRNIVCIGNVNIQKDRLFKKCGYTEKKVV